MNQHITMAFASLLMKACFVFVIMPSCTFAQQKTDFSKVKIFFYTHNDSLLLEKQDGTKKLQFQVDGIKDEYDAAIFTSTMKMYKGIITIKISNPTVNGFRQVDADCKIGYKLENVSYVLGDVFKIPIVYVDNQEVQTKKLTETYQ